MLKDGYRLGRVVVQVERQCFHLQHRQVIFNDGEGKVERIDRLVVLAVHGVELADIGPCVVGVGIDVKQVVGLQDGLLQLPVHLVGVCQFNDGIDIGIIELQAFFQEVNCKVVQIHIVVEVCQLGDEVVMLFGHQFLAQCFQHLLIRFVEPFQMHQ